MTEGDIEARASFACDPLDCALRFEAANADFSTIGSSMIFIREGFQVAE
jgi:hypothetical protein